MRNQQHNSLLFSVTPNLAQIQLLKPSFKCQIQHPIVNFQKQPNSQNQNIYDSLEVDISPIKIQNYLNFQNETDYDFYLSKFIKYLKVNINEPGKNIQLPEMVHNFLNGERHVDIIRYAKKSFFIQTYLPGPEIKKIKYGTIISFNYQRDGSCLKSLVFLDATGAIYMKISNINMSTQYKRLFQYLKDKIRLNFTVIIQYNQSQKQFDFSFYQIIKQINIKRIKDSQKTKKNKDKEKIKNNIVVIFSNLKNSLNQMKYEIENCFCQQIKTLNHSHFCIYQTKGFYLIAQTKINILQLQSILHQAILYRQNFTILRDIMIQHISSFEDLIQSNTLIAQYFALYFNFLIKEPDLLHQNKKKLKSILDKKIIKLFLESQKEYIKKEEENSKRQDCHFYGELQNCKLCVVCLLNWNRKYPRIKQNSEKQDSSKKKIQGIQNLVKKQEQSQLNNDQMVEQIQFNMKGKSLQIYMNELSIQQKEEDDQQSDFDNEDQEDDSQQMLSNSEFFQKKKKQKKQVGKTKKIKKLEQKRNNDQIKRRKTKYKCVGCSIIYRRDIPLCIDCFKEFHNNKIKYIPQMNEKYLKKTDQSSKLAKTYRNSFIDKKSNTKMDSKEINYFQQQPSKQKMDYQVLGQWKKKITVNVQNLQNRNQVIQNDASSTGNNPPTPPTPQINPMTVHYIILPYFYDPNNQFMNNLLFGNCPLEMRKIMNQRINIMPSNMSNYVSTILPNQREQPQVKVQKIDEEKPQEEDNKYRRILRKRK